MSENEKKSVDALGKIIRLLADVWPADRENLAVAGAEFEELADELASAVGLRSLIDVTWQGLMHLYQSDDYFISVKTSTMQGVNLIREYQLRGDEVQIEEVESACNAIEKALRGESESADTLIDAGEGEMADNVDPVAAEPAAAVASAEGETSGNEAGEAVTVGNEAGEAVEPASGKGRDEDEGAGSEEEYSLDDLAASVMELDEGAEDEEQLESIDRMITFLLNQSPEAMAAPLGEALDLIRGVRESGAGSHPGWLSTLSELTERGVQIAADEEFGALVETKRVTEADSDFEAHVEVDIDETTHDTDEGRREIDRVLGETDEPRNPDPDEERGEAGDDEPVADQSFTLPVDIEVDMIEEFVSECDDLIEMAESALLELEEAPDDDELVNTVFRAFHTIKGTSAFMGLDPISEFTHSVETMLSMVREGELQFDAACADISFRSIDIIKELLAVIESAHGGDPLPLPSDHDQLILVLDQISLKGLSPVEALALEGSISAEPVAEKLKAEDVAEDTQTELNTASEAEIPQEVNSSESSNSETSGSEASGSETGELKAVSQETSGSETGEVKAGSQETRGSETDGLTTGGSNPSGSKTKSSTTKSSKTGLPKRSESESSVRVNVNRLDRLVDMVGELVIAHSVVAQDSVLLQDVELQKKVAHTSKILRELQDTSLTLRMVPLKSTFQKMNRLVRDLSRKAGKPVTFSTMGEDTEIDRNMVDVINEPLVHMLRNALDHGIEDPDARKKAGKSEIANIWFRAFQEGGKVVIEIEDDGRGIDKEKILEKAISKGLVEPDARLTDSEIFNLIFKPGFSSVEKVTDLSGRGVGMDVVRRSIEQLQGKIDVSSEQGRGTRISLEIPFTLAITDGMLIRVGSQRFIIPIINIDTAFRAEEEDLYTVMDNSEQVKFQGNTIPVIRLHRLFDIPDAIEELLEGTLLVVRSSSNRYALFVDDVIGQKQLVGKSIDMKAQMNHISGGAILEDGQVGLILDLNTLSLV